VIRTETIDRAIDIIVAQCEPDQVFVVGSHATGNPKRTSDLDLLIVQPSTEAKRKREARVEHLAEAARIVVPGGRVVVSELAGGPRSCEAIAAALAARGCPDARARPRGPFVDVEALRAT
jgi:predicted nucleotidyltransferase